jgi:hypothetical protein
MRTITTDVFVDTAPRSDRTLVPQSEIEAFPLAVKTFDCILLKATIRPEQCATNRTNDLYLCGKCTQEKPQVQARGTRPKERGSNLEPRTSNLEPASKSPWRRNPIFIPEVIRKEALPTPRPKPVKVIAAAPIVKPAKAAIQPVKRVAAAPIAKPVKAAKKVAAPRKAKPVIWPFTPEMDAQIREVYRTGTGKNEVRELAAAFSYPRWAVSKRAQIISAYDPRIKESNWTKAELALLKANAHKCPDRIRLAMKEAGFSRSTTAILLKRRRQGMLQDLAGYSAHALSNLFGVDAHCITGWIDSGWLRAEKRGTARTAVQGGDMWYILKPDVQRFILSNFGLIDIRKVDKFWLLDQVTAGVACDISRMCQSYAAGIGIHQAAVALSEINDRITAKYLTGETNG